MDTVTTMEVRRTALPIPFGLPRAPQIWAPGSRGWRVCDGFGVSVLCHRARHGSPHRERWLPTNPAPPVTSTRSARRRRPSGTFPPADPLMNVCFIWQAEPGATPPWYVSSDAISGEDGYAPLAWMQQQQFIGSFRLNHETGSVRCHKSDCWPKIRGGLEEGIGDKPHCGLGWVGLIWRVRFEMDSDFGV
ncbi:hypothetical protein E2562_019992 [Oryza meyeriana var. granulata]|uniref:Uncharacterized protein n=1 Tax=Oryza meyeriana var. granulata TaxID=110450 RepID=A0A6G1CH50_9ORYZ|nr:hypothetical protein E2562_019992 [Oryza meyeriana var. granulata]